MENITEIKAVGTGNWSFQSAPDVGLIYKNRLFKFWRGGRVTADDPRPFLQSLLHRLQGETEFRNSFISVMDEMIAEANTSQKVIDLWREKDGVSLYVNTGVGNAAVRANGWREAKRIAEWDAATI